MHWLCLLNCWLNRLLNDLLNNLLNDLLNNLFNWLLNGLFGEDLLFNCNFCRNFLSCFEVVDHFWLLDLRFSLHWFFGNWLLSYRLLNYRLLCCWLFRNLSGNLSRSNGLFFLGNH